MSNINNRNNNNKLPEADAATLLQLTPSQAVTSSTTTTKSTSNIGDDGLMTSRRSRRRKRPKGKNKLGFNAPNQRARPFEQHQQNDPRNFPHVGNAPDIYWRSIPIEHLRLHPQFQALPHPDDIDSIETLEDVRNFRQESWQWDALHIGRCTTSQAISALGFLEPLAGNVLSVPIWWQKRSAFARLRQTPLRTLADMNRVLCQPNPAVDEGGGTQKIKVGSNITEPVWVPPSPESNFTMQYTYELTEAEREIRQQEARLFSKDLDRGKFMSRWWGDIHEATSLLVAINYFGQRDDGFMLEETGMCGAGHTFNRTTDDGMLIGATPDGIMRYSDGRVEALEVKNHCPFLAPYANKQRITKKSRKAMNKLYAARSRNFDVSKGLVFPCYVPQLQLEMYCVGEECRSAVMIRLTARSGAMILRMQRDDEWIAEMLYWMNRFQTDFVETGIPPEDNFFWSNASDRSRYQEFVQSTKAKSLRDVELIDRVPFEEIQRMGVDCPLFLD